MAHSIPPLDTAHRGPIHAAQLDHFGRRLATASEDHCVRVWDIQARNPVAELKGHTAPVWSVAWSHPLHGPVLASAGEDRKVLLWREADGDWWQVHSHEVQGAALCVAFAPWEYGLQLAVAAADADGHVTVLSLLDPPPPLSRRKDLQQAFAAPAASEPAGSSGEEDKKVLRNRWRVESFRAHQGGCFALCWAPAASPVVAVAESGTGSPLAAARRERLLGGVPENLGLDAQSAAGPVARAAGASLEPRRMVTGGADNQVRIFRHDEYTKGWADQHHFPSGAHSDWIRDVAWRPNVGIPANTIASCSEDGTVVVWTQAMVGQPWGLRVKWQLGASVWQLSWSITGSILAISTSANQVLLYKESLDGNWERVENVGELEGGESAQQMLSPKGYVANEPLDADDGTPKPLHI